MEFKDHFSSLAARYATFRPEYPPALFDWLAAQLDRHELAWDCGCGNGQASMLLAGRFARVYASDASASQIAEARGGENVQFAVARAEQSGLPDQSADLIVVAQAAHWFDLDAFYREVRRVLRPDGVLALLTYAHHRVTPEVDGPALDFYHNVVGPYWPPERRWVENGYRDLPFPFRELAAPDFNLEAEWDLEHFLGYQATWSATRRYVEATGHDPITALRAAIAPLWGAPETVRTICWPLSLRVGRLLPGA